MACQNKLPTFTLKKYLGTPAGQSIHKYMSSGDVIFCVILHQTNNYTLPKYTSRVIPLQIYVRRWCNFFMMLRRTNHYTLPPHKWQKKMMVCQNKIYSAKVFKYTSRVIPLQILYISGGDVNFFMMLRRTNHYTLPLHKWQKKNDGLSE